MVFRYLVDKCSPLSTERGGTASRNSSVTFLDGGFPGQQAGHKSKGCCRWHSSGTLKHLLSDPQSAALLLLLLLNLTLTAVDLALFVARKDDLTAAARGAGDDAADLESALPASFNIRSLATQVVVSALWLAKTARVVRSWRRSQPEDCSWRSDWTAAACRSTFSETSALIKSTQRISLAYCAALSLLASGAFAAEGAAAGGTPAGAALGALHAVALSANAFLVSLTAYVPIRMWSGAALEAVEITRDRHLRRVLSSHWAALPCVVAHLGIGASGYLRLVLERRPAGQGPISLALALGLVLTQLGATAWVLGCSPREAASAIRRRAKRWLGCQVSPDPSAGPRRGPAGHAARVQPQPQPPLPRRRLTGVLPLTGDSPANGAPPRPLLVRESDCLLRKKVILTFACVSFSLGSFRQAWYVTGLLLAYRLAAIVLLLLTRDEPISGFRSLRAHGAGFGLVVNSRQLREALRLHLAGGRYGAPLEKYKASLFRMTRALAVSYRWQATERCICDGLTLNMSTWQIRALHGALRSSGMDYVWIDKVSVPQRLRRQSSTQKALLARMMAVYSSAQATLCLRSIEAEGSRYHQRAWTLQEYCAASRVQLCTELCSSCAGGDLQCPECMGELAVAGDEANFFDQLRKLQVTRRIKCRPFWMYGCLSVGLGIKEAVDIVETFYDLQNRVNCENASDKVRSLYPMLTNIPVESHTELRRLVTLVSRIVMTSWAAVLSGEAENSVQRCAEHAHQSMACLNETGGAALRDMRARRSLSKPQRPPRFYDDGAISSHRAGSAEGSVQLKLSNSIQGLKTRSLRMKNSSLLSQRSSLAPLKLPAEVRVMETLVSPSSENGWSQRDQYLQLAPRVSSATRAYSTFSVASEAAH
mmetsp:Transcript_14752/g.35136  ORF Transcript_14752/g.35136 Transcript_14752/m.35136 type:complete len:877 (+) Transcript_14752:333-2963(+)